MTQSFHGATTNGFAVEELAKNRSVVWVSPANVTPEYREVPQLGDHDVLIEVIVTGICGSDAHVWESNPAKKPPVLGHESAGVIRKVGSKVIDRFVGQRVAIEPGVPCLM